jgi:peptide/nickel transport system substrate-binding protein
MCLTAEPSTLYLYGGNAPAMWSVLEAVYDGPFDTRGYSVQPVILQSAPGLESGDAVLQPAPVQRGAAVVDVAGNLVALEAGVNVLPSGCAGPECAVAWDGQSELVMDQLTVTFRLLPGILWSDGQPLTARDSVFSFNIASDPATPVSKYLVDRTESYTAADDQTVVWTGLPGFYDPRFATFFWLPLPEHALQGKSAADLLQDPAAARSPLGWGPYILEEWVAGDHITLRKNPAYFRAAEGLPKFDTLVYRFVGETGDANLNALLAGECDAVDTNPRFLEMIPDLELRVANGRIKILSAVGPEWEHLSFGIRPAAYDDGYNPADGDRVDFFGDPRTRQAVAYCVDRETIQKNLLYGKSAVPGSFLLPGHPLAAADLPALAYNPTEGQRLLEEVGWRDTDNNPDTPRVAAGVNGVPDGTPFAITYATTQAALRQQTAQAVIESLRGCGIQASLQSANPGELFAPGPDGPVFGRRFDLVQFSWESSTRSNCLLYTTSQIPSPTNQWIGANITGYSNPAFDSACAAAGAARGGAEAARPVQEIFARELPVLPLFAQVKLAIARPDLCGLDLDATARSIFHNIEAFDIGACP